MVAPEPRWTRVDRWEIRCRFNRANFAALAATGELEFRVSRRRPVTPNPRDPLPDNYKFTCEWFFKDTTTGRKVADGHFYELDDGSTTDLDPKHLRIGESKYALYEGTGRYYEFRRDKTVFVRRGGLLYRAYVRWRRFTCRRWGR